MSQEQNLEDSADSEAVQDTRPTDAGTLPEEHGQHEEITIARQTHCEEPKVQETERPDSPETITSSQPEAAENGKSASELHEAEIAEPKTQKTSGVDDISPVEKSSSLETTVDDNPGSEQPGHFISTVLTFKRGRRTRYVPIPEQKLRNNLSPSVGFLEFANATDFAANVWNMIPVSTYAAVLMGLGGSIAIILSFFALKDGILCWRNVRLLRKERAQLLGSKQDEEKAEKTPDDRSLDIRLEVNRREFGQEMVDRYLMDVFMGFSSLVVGVGTLMAIGGANPHVYRASNLLSGYIGNSPSSLWGIGNAL
jgi:hypothetical protein